MTIVIVHSQDVLNIPKYFNRINDLSTHCPVYTSINTAIY